MHKIDEKLDNVTARMARAAQNAPGLHQPPQLIAVSKTQPGESVRRAYQWGQRRFGENYLQEALDKQAELADCPGIEWHFIGPIQSNKTRAMAEHFDWVHSVDRLKIARRLSEQRPPAQGPLPVCLQVNIDGEPSKSGARLDELADLARAVDDLPGLSLRGLMAIPAPREGADQREPFARLRRALESLRTLGLNGPLDTLSMGMSADLEAAVAEGATFLRIGTDIFGPRPTPSPSAKEST